MNINAILALLVLKNIITQDEAELVAEYVHDKPQSSILSEVINQIKELLPMNQQPLTGGPEQQAEELAARERHAAEAKAADEEAAKAGESEGTDEAENADEDKSASEDKSADSNQSKK